MDKPTRRRIDGQILLSGLANFVCRRFLSGRQAYGLDGGYAADLFSSYRTAVLSNG